jgi:aspartate aminotransferase
MKKRRDLFIDTFNDSFHCKMEKPPSALYAFIPLSIFQKTLTSSEHCIELMTKANFACVPGVTFGSEGYLRMAFAEKEEVLREGLITLQEPHK